MDPYFPGGSARGENVCFVLFCVCVFLSFHNRWMLNTLRPRQNSGRFADDILDCVLLNENVWISIKISLKFLPNGPINNVPALVPIMTWRRPGDKPSSEPMMVSLLTHTCATRPQWVKYMNYHFFSSLHDIFPSCAHVQVVYVFISIVQSIFLSIISPFCHWWPLPDYAPKHNLFNTVMLNSLAIYSNLKLLINFLFCIIQKRAIKFWGEHFSIRIKTPSRHGNATKAIIKHFRLKLNLYIKFAKGKIIWYQGRC